MTVDKQELFTVLHADKDMVLTNYKDEQDIKEYNGSAVVYCPKTFDIGVYREITKGQADKYEAAKEKAFEEEINDHGTDSYK